MEIPLREVLSILCPKYKMDETVKPKAPPLSKFKKKGFQEKSVLREIISSVCYQQYDTFNVDNELSEMLSLLNKNELIDTLNDNKIIRSIETESVTNDLILFLSCYYECNIYVFYEKTRVVRVYSPLEKINSSQTSVLIFSTLNNNYKAIDEGDNLDYDTICSMFPGILFIALGLEYGKKLIVGDCEPVSYIKGPKPKPMIVDHLNEITLSRDVDEFKPLKNTWLNNSKQLAKYYRRIYDKYKNSRFTSKN